MQRVRRHAAAGSPARSPQDEIVERLIYPMINEGAKILEEGKAIRASDIDIIWINGYNWPAYRGGPMFYADQIGLDKVLARLQELDASAGPQWTPAPLLERLVAEGKTVRRLAGRRSRYGPKHVAEGIQGVLNGAIAEASLHRVWLQTVVDDAVDAARQVQRIQGESRRGTRCGRVAPAATRRGGTSRGRTTGHSARRCRRPSASGPPESMTGEAPAVDVPGDALHDEADAPAAWAAAIRFAVPSRRMRAFAATPPLEVGVTVGQVGELVDDGVGAERGERVRKRRTVVHVAQHRLGAEGADRRDSGRCPGHRRHHVTGGDQTGNEVGPHHAAAAGDEDALAHDHRRTDATGGAAHGAEVGRPARRPDE